MFCIATFPPQLTGGGWRKKVAMARPRKSKYYFTPYLDGFQKYENFIIIAADNDNRNTQRHRQAEVWSPFRSGELPRFVPGENKKCNCPNPCGEITISLITSSPPQPYIRLAEESLLPEEFTVGWVPRSGETFWRKKKKRKK